MDLLSTAQLLGNFGEFVGAVAVVATLGYLAFEIRHNTRATRASLDYSIRSDFNRWHELMMTNPEMVKLAARLGSPDEDHQAKSFANWFLNRFANVQTALDADILPQHDFPAWKADFARQLQLFPGMVPHMREQLKHYPGWSETQEMFTALHDANEFKPTE